MALPITIPYTFGSATTAIPLSNLDSDYQTVYYAVNGLGNGSVSLANVSITGGTASGNITLSNVTISSVATAITPAQGGTGLTAVGTSGNVLTSNGTAWISQAAGAATGNVTYGNATVSLGGSSSSIGNIAIANVTITNYVETLQAVGTVGATATLSLTTGTFLTATLTASTPCTFTMPSAVGGKSFILKLIQASSGMTTATFTSVKWPGGTAPTITATASAVDILSFVSDGTNWYGTFAQAFA
jgi:hypothetical protein